MFADTNPKPSRDREGAVAPATPSASLGQRFPVWLRLAQVKAQAKRLALVVALLLAGGVVSPLSAQRVLIKMGTIAPKDSPWYQILQQMGQDWKKISDGKVTLRIYPGGVLGDELAMVKKMRIGQLQAVGMSGAGMTYIEPAISCLQIPMMIESYAELDYVRDRIAPRLEKMLDEKGYVVLTWGDAGWVHFFTKKPARTLDDIRRLKLYTGAGDPDTERAFRDFGFQPVPLAITDMLTALQTGLIDAFDVPPLLALLNQWFGVASHMTAVRWAPLIGATLIRKRTWNRIPPGQRDDMLKAARAAGEKLRGEIRGMGDEAVTAMEKRGLQVVELDQATLAQWRREAENAYPKLRGTLVPADLFDEVRRLRDEYRAGASQDAL